MPDDRAPIGPLTIKLHPADNVVVARADLLPGTGLPGTNVVTRAHVPAGHKVAVAPVARDEPLRKYDQIIGFATTTVQPDGQRSGRRLRRHGLLHRGIPGRPRSEPPKMRMVRRA